MRWRWVAIYLGRVIAKEMAPSATVRQDLMSRIRAHRQADQMSPGEVQDQTVMTWWVMSVSIHAHVLVERSRCIDG